MGSKTSKVKDIGLSVKKLRKQIPKKIKDEVWINYNGKNWYGKCFCCKSEIELTSWHIGHIESVATGGSDRSDNLVPLCINCNLSMGKKNLNEYMKIYYPNKAVARKKQ